MNNKSTNPTTFEYNNVIDFIFALKAELDKGYKFADYLYVFNNKYEYYVNVDNGALIGFLTRNKSHINGLPPFISFSAYYLTQWIKENSKSLERLKKLKGFI